MTNEEIARELMALGIEWRRGMSDGEDRVMVAGVGPDGTELCLAGWDIEDTVDPSLMKPPDLDDPATFALCLEQVREWWEQPVVLVERPDRLPGHRVQAAYPYGQDAWHIVGQGDTRTEAMLAAARAANGDFAPASSDRGAS